MLEQKIWERRLTLEEFAEYAEVFAREHKEPGTLGVRHLQRLIAGRKPSGEPLGSIKPVTARLLERIFDTSVDELLAEPRRATAERTVPVRASRERAESDLAVALDWLDERAGWSPGTSRRKVNGRLAELDEGKLLDRSVRRASVSRTKLARALVDYYGGGIAEYAPYRIRCGEREIATSVLTRADWLDLAQPLFSGGDRLAFTDRQFEARPRLDEVGAAAAVSRLAESAVLGVRITNSPLYRLLDVNVGPAIEGTVGLVPFVEYALTMDLLEGELVDAVVGGAEVRRGSLPLRDKYLSDLASALDVSSRVCAGGVLALCAIARPSDPFRGGRDYALLVPERSGHVLNAARRLAVIPKGFHEPLTDLRADAQLAATLRREMEEELFGREDIDSTAAGDQAAVPMHLSRMSEPMRWLMDKSGRLRVECTGFGLNLISGNYEFASLIVIDDEEFWARYGGEIEANWETAGLRLYSSLDGELISDLVSQENWSNEGLFAFLQGLWRLSAIGDERVNLPRIDVMFGTANGR
ncbi:transcriptional regulator [Allokutzneria sp. A3M-2-11 16]|uniref:transcriptional regulator n=1 Tax=Allokutzneria sp. A3M-2-11 16 TaxID=2962043 RepID=UPI0020B6CEF4|nr:transcriptional regulator [Allokutzneria sp. A3M-2-11 16]MCP3803461.1 transcriptional regulator [Allokutzneria sp. A3M-2-11 16]